MVLSCLKDWNYDPPRPPRLAFSLFFTVLSSKQLLLVYELSPALKGPFVAHTLKFEKSKLYPSHFYVDLFSADITMYRKSNFVFVLPIEIWKNPSKVG